MIDLDTAGVVGAIALSTAAYASVRIVRQNRAKSAPDPLRRLPPPLQAPAVAVRGAARVEGAATVRIRRVVATGRTRTPRPGAASSEVAAELLALVGTMQWDRALAAIRRRQAAGEDLAAAAGPVEALALERLRALPAGEARVALAGWRMLAALVPGDASYGARASECLAAVDARREALMAGLTRDEDRNEAGTVWLNHPWNPRFDDVRLPVWLYLGVRAGHPPVLRLRTNWLGDSRISVQGIEVIHDGMAETLTLGAYKIDADALGWEWRDEPADVYQVEVLRSLIAAREVALRYKGDPWMVEVDMAEDERQAVAEMIELYDLLRAASPAEARQAAAA